MTRNLPAAGLLCALAGCGLVDPHPSGSIAGRYDLLTVDAQSVPCCTRTDSASGVRTTPLSGTLTLGAAAPEDFVDTPGAGTVPRSCVQTVPDGSRVHADTVFRGDGSWYLLPPCGLGEYSMTLTVRVDSAGESRTVSTTDTGRYSWSRAGPVDVAGMTGAFSGIGGTIRMTLQARGFGIQPRVHPAYGFARLP